MLTGKEATARLTSHLSHIHVLELNHAASFGMATLTGL